MKRYMWVFLLMNASVSGDAVDSTSTGITIENGTDEKIRVTIYPDDKRQVANLASEVLSKDELIHADSVVTDNYRIILEHMDTANLQPELLDLPAGSYLIDSDDLKVRVWTGVPANPVRA